MNIMASAPTLATAPTADLYDGIKRAFPQELFPWDDYFLRMAETDFLAGRADTPAVKSYFVRRAPFGGSYMLLGGITAALRLINELRFNTPEFADGLRRMNYTQKFIDHMTKRKGLFKIKVYAPPEGTPFFPNEPIISIEGPSLELRLADAIIISENNFASLSLTKWNRLVRVARPGGVMEFSRRRAQNQMKASLYGMLAGCVATSNAELGRYLQVPVRGTMGHEWMQSFASVREAFDTWLTHQPHLPVGLVDTVRCMEVDFPEWLDAVYRHRDAIKKANPALWGWRNDSGDLAYLSIEQYDRFFRHRLAGDPWFAERMRIFLTNELDEYAIASIISQISTESRAAGFNAEDLLRRIVWAAGTKPGVCEDEPAIGGVMKLMESDGKPCIKLALDADGRVGIKTSIPGFNLSALVRNKAGEAMGILLYPARRYNVTPEGKLFDSIKNRVVETLQMIHPDNESLTQELSDYTVTARQKVVFDGGLTKSWELYAPTIQSVQALVKKATDELPWWISRIEKPHSFPVSVTPDLFKLRQQMIRDNALQSVYPIF